MAYEEFAAIIEAHKEEIARQVAEEVLARKLSPTNASLEEFTRLMLIPLQMMMRYLQTGDISEITNYSKQYIASRLEQGATADSMQSVNEVFFIKLKALLEKELPGPENENLRKVYNRRLDGIKTLANTTTISSSVQKNTQ